MKIKDHFLSQKVFEVRPSKYKGILETYPQPPIEELPKYYDSSEYISHQTKANTLKDLVYQKVKSVMINRKRKWVYDYNTSGRILDIGSGTGDFLNAFKDEFWQKGAVEPSEKLHNNLKEKGIKLFEQLKDIKSDEYNVITLWHSLEHIPDLESTLKELKRILKSDGTIFVAVPNYKSFDADFYKSFWAAWDVPRHLWHFSRSGIKSLFSDFEFQCIDDKALIFDAYYVSLLSEKYHPKGKKLRSFYTGWLSNVKAKSNQQYSSILYVFKAK